MATQTLDKVIIDGYDLAAEKARYRFPDVVGRGLTLNRGTAIVKIRGEMENSRYQAGRAAHNKRMFLTTHDDDSPEPVLKGRQLTRSFGDGESRAVAVNDVSIDLHATS